jgi:hypothetical protein
VNRTGAALVITETEEMPMQPKLAELPMITDARSLARVPVQAGFLPFR